MKKIALFSIFAVLALPAYAEDGELAYRSCNGLVTSNGSCIGSESNVNSWSNHEPYYSRHGRSYGGRSWGYRGRRW
jgi:hypothetical protein